MDAGIFHLNDGTFIEIRNISLTWQAILRAEDYLTLISDMFARSKPVYKNGRLTINCKPYDRLQK